MPNVQAPDGTVVNFPDSMKPEDIAGVMQKQFPIGGSGHADPSYWEDLKAGANSAMETTGTALQGTGGILSRNGLPGGETISGAGDFLKRNAPEVPQNYHNRGGDIISDLKQGEFSRAAGDVAHGVASAAAPAAAAIGAGALGSTAGLPAAAGAGLVGGVMGLGAGAGERAATEGKAVPDTNDMLRAAPRAAADAILSGIGPGKLAARSGTALTRAATMGGTSAAQSGVDQFDTTGKIDPEQVGNAAITGAATAGATEIPGAVRGAAKAGSDAVMSRVVGAPEGQDAQQSTVRVANAVKDQMSAQPGLRLTDAANRVKLDLVQQANRVLQQNKSAIDPQDFREIRSDINNGALRQNNTVGDDTFNQIDSLSIPDEQKQALTEYTRDLNTASTQSFIKNTTGPLQKIGGAVGHVGAIGLGLASGNPLEMAAGVLGHSIAGRIGSGLGAMGDRFLGTNTPEVLLRAQAAARALKGAGQDPNSIQSTPTPGAPEAPEVPQPVSPIGPAMSALRAAKSGAALPTDTVSSFGPAMSALRSAQAGAGPAPEAPVPMSASSFGPAGSALARAKAAAALLQRNPAGLDEVGNPVSPIPVNTPLPALRVNTPRDVQDAMAQDDGLPPSQSALQAAQQAQATPGAPTLQAPPTGLQGPGRGHAYVAAGNPNVSAQAIHDAATHLESTGALPAGTAAGLASGVMPAQAKLIQAHLGITPNLGGPQGDVPTINSPIRYQAAVKGYQSAVAAKAADLRAAGQTQAADALVDIAVNHHTQAGKRAARASLPMHIAAQIPDFVVNHGGK